MNKKPLFVLLATLLLLCGCAAKKTTAECFAMDTVIDLTAYGSYAAKALELAQEELYRLDALLSVSGETSEIAQLNSAETDEVSPETAALLQRALELSGLTDGAYDCTVYPLVQAWGFFSGDYRVPDAAELDALLAATGWEKVQAADTTVTLPAGMAIDLGGIAKGYASARVKAVLADAGVRSAIVSLGGNVSALGKKPDGSDWTVAIQDPDDTQTYFALVQIADQCVITSGGYQRYFEQDGQTYWHILDPKTGVPAQSGLLSVSIISQDDALADGLSTALFVMGLDKAAEFWRAHASKFDAILMTTDRSVYITQGLTDCYQSELPYEVLTK